MQKWKVKIGDKWIAKYKGKSSPIRTEAFRDANQWESRVTALGRVNDANLWNKGFQLVSGVSVLIEGDGVYQEIVNWEVLSQEKSYNCWKIWMEDRIQKDMRKTGSRRDEYQELVEFKDL